MAMNRNFDYLGGWQKLKPDATRIVKCVYCKLPMRDIDLELLNHIAKCPVRNQFPEIKKTDWVY